MSTKHQRESSNDRSVSTLVDLLRWQTAKRPNNVVYTELDAVGRRRSSVTVFELERSARSIAAQIQQIAKPADRVVITCANGLSFIRAFAGCIYAGVTAVPAIPPTNRRRLDTLRLVLTDCEARAIIGEERHCENIEGPNGPHTLSIQRMEAAAAQQALDDKWSVPDLTADSLAFLQYTSGSTGRPKGVMVSHGNVLHNESCIAEAFGQTENSKIVSWLPMFHDMGLVGGVLQPLWTGATCFFLPTTSVMQRPFYWLSTISALRADTSGGPNFVYDACVDRISDEELTTLDLSCWQVAFNGSDSVRPETLERFAARFTGRGFRATSFFPCYGLAEATLLVAGSKAGEVTPEPLIKDVGGLKRVVSCGLAARDHQTLIMNPETGEECGEGKTGEICVSGASVAQGYWNRPNDTEEAFPRRLIGGRETRVLRTGDLGFTSQGQLYVTGRIKDLIIIRGHNYHAEDIERTVEDETSDCPRGRAVAFSINEDRQERVVVVKEVDRLVGVDMSTIMSTIRRIVGLRHEVEVHAVVLVRSGTLPKTSSGKIQRFACKEMFLQNALKVLAKWTRLEAPVPDLAIEDGVKSSDEIEKRLAVCVGAICGDQVLDPVCPMIAFGIDSMRSVELANRVAREFGVVVPPTMFLSDTTIAGLARHIRQAPSLTPLPETMVGAESRTRYPLSYGQYGIWFDQLLRPEISTYNIATAFEIRAGLDVAALRRALKHFIGRHSALRTTFHVSPDGAAFQVVHDDVEISVNEQSTDSEGLGRQLSKEALKPFDLEQAPLMRVCLFRRDADDTVLLLVMHHIIADMSSAAILVRELCVLYSSEIQGQRFRLPEPRPFADRVDEEIRFVKSDGGELAYRYWEEYLSGSTADLNLSIDQKIPMNPSYRCGSEYFTLNEDTTESLKRLASDNRATLYMLLVAIYLTLLHRLTSQADIVIGSPIHGREDDRYANTIGFFVNTLVLRAKFRRNSNFMAVLSSMREGVIAAYDHQRFPFQLLVQRLGSGNNHAKSPLFQTMFILHRVPSAQQEAVPILALRDKGVPLQIGPLTAQSVSIPEQLGNFPLTLIFVERGGKLSASLEYQTDLFTQSTARQFTRQFQVLVQSVLANPKGPVSDFKLLEDAERERIVNGFANTAAPELPEFCIHDLIHARVGIDPDSIAVRIEDGQLSYLELDRRANQLARYLVKAGIRAETPVAVFLERSLELIVGVLAVLKAGGAYVPMDRSFPKERIELILSETRAPLTLTQQTLQSNLPTDSPKLCLDTDWAAIAKESAEQVPSPSQASHLAYIIYTSGSTGRPKGAMNTHHSLMNRILWMQHDLVLGKAHTVLQKTPVIFDVSVWELFLPLVSGACLIFAAPDEHRDVSYLAKLVEKESVTTVHFVPSLLRRFVQQVAWNSCCSLQHVIASGEALSVDIQEEFFGKFQADLFNYYGPTEAAIDVTSWKCRRDDAAAIIPIGYPIWNTRMYVLDAGGEPVPVGVSGELHIGGAPPGRGYLHRPGLTAEAFVPDPFVAHGGRCYKTGDFARFREDGRLEFLGRQDDQVKVRGFRIELEEIETALRRLSGIEDAKVTVSDGATADTHLVAYVVAESTSTYTPAILRTELKAKLPEYMVPNTFMLISDIPLLPNGKVDRRKLPAVAVLRDDVSQEFISPRNPTEAAIARIWEDVLGIEPIGVSDNLFELGGHSLLVNSIVAGIHEQFQVDVPLREFFDEPTVEALATFVETARLESQEHSS